MKHFFILCMICAVSIFRSHGQENSNYWAIKAGVNFANFTNSDYTSNCQTGFNVGASRAFLISKQAPLYVQGGLSFEMKGARNSYLIEGIKIENTAKSYAVELPILLNYNFKISKKSTIIPFVGVFYSFAVAGDLEEGGDSTDPYKKEEVLFEGEESTINTRLFSRSDFGIRVGADYKYTRYSIGIAYDAGLTNLYAKEFSDRNYEASTGSFSINLGYYF
ncbi:MAG: outer membrane beta-barrel protein [Rikenellaceae bacterium]